MYQEGCVVVGKNNVSYVQNVFHDTSFSIKYGIDTQTDTGMDISNIIYFFLCGVKIISFLNL